MKHLLQQKVRAVARRATRVVLAHAVLQVVAGMIAAGLILGGLDYLLRFQDLGIRWLSSLGWLAVIGWTWRRYLQPAWRYRPTDVAIARHIEQMSPAVRSNLASSIAFLAAAPDDASAGSAQLRQAVIEKTAATLDELPCNAVVSSSPARRIAAVVCVFTAIVGIAAVGNRRATLLAAQRLAAPWAALPWPRRHVLEFENPPPRIAAGEPFEVQLHDRNGELPERVEIQILPIQNEDAKTSAATAEPSTFAMTFLDGKMVYRRNNVQRPFRYRAVGGDDNSMPWRQLDVVEAVYLESLRVEVRPPAYTGWPVVQSEGEITAISGSRVLLAGRVSRALSAASVVIEGDEKREIALELSDDRTNFRLTADAAPWVLESSGFYWLKLVDQDDIASGAEARWDLHITPDRAPTVALESPSGATYLTVGGFLEVQAHCQDDLLLQAIELRYRINNEKEEHVVPLFAGSAAAPTVETPQFDRVDQRAVRYRWLMENIADLAYGSELRFYLAAQDYKPQEGRTPMQSVHIIDPESLRNRLANQQGEVLAGLLQALRMQRQSRGQTRALGIQLEETKSIAGGDVVQFQNALLQQQNVQREIAGESGGVATKIETVLARLESSGVQNLELKERFQKLQAKIHRLAEGPLPQVERELSAGIASAREHRKSQKGVDKNTPDSKNTPGKGAFAETARAVHDAGQLQDGILGELQEAIEDFQQWGRFQSLARAARQLQREQEELRKQTSQQRLQTLAKSTEELSNQQRADLKKLAVRQQGVAERFQGLENDMEQAAEQMREQKKPAAQTLDDALRASRRHAASAGVRESSRRISENRLSEALAAQRNAEQALGEVLDILSHRRTHELQRIVEGLARAQQELNALKKHAQKLAQALAANTAEKVSDEQLQQAAEEQQALGEQMRQLARQLKRLRADQAAEALQAAAEAARQSSQAAEKENRPEAHQAAQEVEPRMEEAREAVRQALLQARIDHLHEQLQLLAGALDALLPRQQGIFDELRRLAQGSAGKLASRSAISALGKQEDAQRTAVQEAKQHTQDLQLPPAFEFGLAGAVREMQRTAALLGRQEADAAVAAADRAVQRMEALRAAIRAGSESARPPEANAAGQQNPPGAEKKAAGPLPSLAELRLLKQLQDGVNRRTAELNSVRSPTSGLTPSQDEELQQLVEEQARLAEILAGFRAALAESFSEPAGEPSPESLPEEEALPKIDDSELLPQNNDQE